MLAMRNSSRKMQYVRMNMMFTDTANAIARMAIKSKILSTTIEAMNNAVRDQKL